MKKLLGMACGLIALGMSSVQAGPISGEISMTGDWAPLGGGTVGSATGIDFLGDDFSVTAATGDFATTISAGDTGTINDFTFNPFPGSVNPLWSVGGFDFDLTSLTIGIQTSSFLVLTGGGTISAAGYDDTAGSWVLTGNGFQSTFSWSSSTIPEPASLALLGLGLLGLGAARRRKAA